MNELLRNVWEFLLKTLAEFLGKPFKDILRYSEKSRGHPLTEILESNETFPGQILKLCQIRSLDKSRNIAVGMTIRVPQIPKETHVFTT